MVKTRVYLQSGELQIKEGVSRGKFQSYRKTGSLSGTKAPSVHSQRDELSLLKGPSEKNTTGCLEISFR